MTASTNILVNTAEPNARATGDGVAAAGGEDHTEHCQDSALASLLNTICCN
jgi:hypothetical protein